MSKRLENAKALYLKGIRDGNPIEAVNAYTGDRYTQHSTGVKDGREGFIEFFTDFIARNPERDIQIVRGWEDGQYVFLQVYQNIGNGQAEWVTTDFFDTDTNGKIIEHWDVISAFTGPNAKGRTQVDGPTEIVDLHQTEANKTLVRNLIQNAQINRGNPQYLDRYLHSDYIQHTPEEPHGLVALQTIVSDSNRETNYQEIVLLVGQGNFVATLSRVQVTDDRRTTMYACVDIFRCENGKVAEHWNNVETVPANDVNSGKF